MFEPVSYKGFGQVPSAKEKLTVLYTRIGVCQLKLCLTNNPSDNWLSSFMFGVRFTTQVFFFQYIVLLNVVPSGYYCYDLC